MSSNKSNSLQIRFRKKINSLRKLKKREKVLMKISLRVHLRTNLLPKTTHMCSPCSVKKFNRKQAHRNGRLKVSQYKKIHLQKAARIYQIGTQTLGQAEMLSLLTNKRKSISQRKALSIYLKRIHSLFKFKIQMWHQFYQVSMV